MKPAVFFILLLLTVWSGFSVAGVVRNGYEWELRGTLMNFSGHQAEHATDSGWTWATSSHWLSSGLNLKILSDPEWSKFIGPCDGLAGQFCDAYLRDDPDNGLRWTLVSDSGADTFGLPALVDNQSNGNLALYRLSLRPVPNVQLPIPFITYGLLFFLLILIEFRAGIGDQSSPIKVFVQKMR